MSRTTTAWLLFVILIVFNITCKNHRDVSNEGLSSKTPIDTRSYNLGVIGAFAEVVDIGIKKLALSSPMTIKEMDALMEDARRIASNNHVQIWCEDNFLVTDLFPAEITQGKHVLLIYKDPIKEAYLNLKAQKEQLVQSGQYTGKARENIARSMGELLSYPTKRIDALLNNSQNR